MLQGDALETGIAIMDTAPMICVCTFKTDQETPAGQNGYSIMLDGIGIALVRTGRIILILHTDGTDIAGIKLVVLQAGVSMSLTRYTNIIFHIICNKNGAQLNKYFALFIIFYRTFTECLQNTEVRMLLTLMPFTSTGLIMYVDNADDWTMVPVILVCWITQIELN